MGQQLLVTSDDGPEHVRAVARFVDETMHAMAAEAGAVATLEVALLAALNIASEYHKLRDEHQKQSETVERLARRLMTELPG
jgi:cell division protein ZapA